MTENRASTNVNSPLGDPNHHMPSSAELSAFRTGELNKLGANAVQANPYAAYVTGGYTGNTDEIIQWAAIKWGLPLDLMRAIGVSESFWNQLPPGGICTNCSGNSCGDFYAVSSQANYPAFSRVTVNNTPGACQSLGIAQVKWNHPDVNDSNPGTKDLRWQSTAFNLDFAASSLRFFFDDPNHVRTSWGDPSYVECQNWNSVGAYYQPYPWGNSGQSSYVTRIQNFMNVTRDWTKSSFPPAQPR